MSDIPVNGDMMRGVVEPIILKLLSDKTKYGYEIIRIVNEKTDNAFQWKEGTIYPCLHRLETDGMIKSDWQTAENGKRRKYYSITKKGLAEMQTKVNEWSVFSKSVNALLFGLQVSCKPV